MGNNTTTKGSAVMTAIALFFAAIDFCYLNSTVSGFWSWIFVGCVIAASLAASVKLGTGLGINNAWINISDRFFSFVTLIIGAVLVLQALSGIWSSGEAGFFAAFAVLTLIPLALFGIFDAWVSIGGSKFIGDAIERAHHHYN